MSEMRPQAVIDQSRKRRKRMYQILIVEDDRGLNQGIALALRQEGVSFLQAYNAAEGRDFWEKGHVDMALLDLSLIHICFQKKE